jgi:hypothetical protein
MGIFPKLERFDSAHRPQITASLHEFYVGSGIALISIPLFIGMI